MSLHPEDYAEEIVLKRSLDCSSRDDGRDSNGIPLNLISCSGELDPETRPHPS